MKRTRFLGLAAAASLWMTQLSFGQSPVTPEEAFEIAKEAYIYAYPQVLVNKTGEVATNVEVPNFPTAPFNQIAHARAFPDDTFTIVVRPNADTLYSTLSFDVSKEPLLFHIPASQGRYYLMVFMDNWSEVFASIGSRTNGNGEITFAIVGPDWVGKLPDGVREYRSPTGKGLLIGRTQTNGKSDYAAVHQFQDGMKVAPLSRFHSKEAAPKGTVSQTQDMSPPPTQVDTMSGEDFFAYFTQLWAQNPPHGIDYPILDRLERIGLIAGQRFDFEKAPAHVKEAIKQAPAPALAEIKETWKISGHFSNGWRTNLTAIGTYGADYLHRAAVAYGALGANVPEDALYPTTFVDESGKRLDSGKRYILHFEKGQLPPVRAFWSLTMYDDKQLFSANELSRFAIGDRDPLLVNDDGSVDIYIQRDNPGDGKTINWLPTPKAGNFSMNMRLYWPRHEASSGQWTPPPVREVSP